MSSVTVDRPFGPFFPTPIKSKSCPTIIRRKDSAVQEAVQELLTTGQVSFECTNNQTTYNGKIIHISDIKQKAHKLGLKIFQSQIYVMNHATIPPGTLFLHLSTQPPTPDNFL